MSAPEPQAEASDFGRLDPTPYDFGITDDPEATWPDAQPDAYVTEIWCPPVDDGVHRLHVRMPDPEPLPEPEPEAQLEAAVPELEAGL